MCHGNPGRFDITEWVRAETQDQIDLKGVDILSDGDSGFLANPERTCSHGLIPVHHIPGIYYGAFFNKYEEVEIGRAAALVQGRGLTSVYDEMSSLIGQKVIIRCFWHATAHHRRVVLAYVFG